MLTRKLIVLDETKVAAHTTDELEETKEVRAKSLLPRGSPCPTTTLVTYFLFIKSSELSYFSIQINIFFVSLTACQVSGYVAVIIF